MICHNCFVLSLVALLAIGISSDEQLKRGAYHVSLQRNNVHMCGGALISKSHVLTAAKCLVGHGGRHQKEGLTIVTNLESLGRDGNQRHTADFVQIHPNFYEGDAQNHSRNDIAVITLNPEVSMDSTAQIIALPKDNFIDSTQLAQFTGHGESILGFYSPVGLTFRFEIASREYCERKYNISHLQLCTKGVKGSEICSTSGDEGGPLEHNFTVVGILSYRISKCCDGEPEVYTRVASYREFITEAMNRRPGSFNHRNRSIDNPWQMTDPSPFQKRSIDNPWQVTDPSPSQNRPIDNLWQVTDPSPSQNRPIDNPWQVTDPSPSQNRPIDNPWQVTDSPPSQNRPIDNLWQVTDPSPSQNRPIDNPWQVTDPSPSQNRPIDNPWQVTDPSPSQNRPIDNPWQVTDSPPSQNRPIDNLWQVTDPSPSQNRPIDNPWQVTDPSPSQNRPIDNPWQVTDSPPSQNRPIDNPWQVTDPPPSRNGSIDNPRQVTDPTTFWNRPIDNTRRVTTPPMFFKIDFRV